MNAGKENLANSDYNVFLSFILSTFTLPKEGWSWPKSISLIPPNITSYLCLATRLLAWFPFCLHFSP